jgi:exodeoxyribonuclease V alpha subunit
VTKPTGRPSAADLAAMLRDIEATAARNVEAAAARRNVPPVPVETRASRQAAAEAPAEERAPRRERPEQVREASAQTIRELAELLGGAGVPRSYTAVCAAFLGEGAAERLRADPWELLLVPGVLPQQADHFARQVLGETASPGDPRRGRALVAQVLGAAARQGHTVLPAEKVAERLVALKVADPGRAVADALDEALVVSVTVQPPDEEQEPAELLALARHAMAEEAAAEGFLRLAATAGPLEGAPVADGVTLFSGPASEEAVTTLAARASAAGLRVLVAAPTERRAADLSRAGTPVLSLARMLEAVPAPDGVAYRRDERSPLEADLVVVADADALDVELAAALVEACPDGARLVLAGDPARLGPGGAGQVFADLLRARRFPVVRTQSAGPEAEGPVERLLGAVREGELVQVDAPGREVVVVPAAEAAEAVHRAVQLVSDSIPRAIGVPPEDVQVVCPGTRGDAGTTALNKAMKARLNPGEGAFGGFDPGDRVIAVTGLEGAPAGETGVVKAGGPRGLEVVFPSGVVEVPPGQVWRLRHGWAVTVQQAAGTRWPAVVAVFPPGEPLSRALVVTAVGRAERHLSIVQAAGPELARAVAGASGRPRETRLAELLQDR